VETLEIEPDAPRLTQALGLGLDDDADEEADAA
jgi:hypothetical protein